MHQRGSLHRGRNSRRTSSHIHIRHSTLIRAIDLYLGNNIRDIFSLLRHRRQSLRRDTLDGPAIGRKARIPIHRLAVAPRHLHQRHTHRLSSGFRRGSWGWGGRRRRTRCSTDVRRGSGVPHDLPGHRRGTAVVRLGLLEGLAGLDGAQQCATVSTRSRGSDRSRGRRRCGRSTWRGRGRRWGTTSPCRNVHRHGGRTRRRRRRRRRRRA